MPTQFHHQCPCYHIMNDMLECYLWASSHQSFDCWREHHVYYVASQPRTSDHLIYHRRALCLLAYDNWRCSIQPEIFHSSKCRARAGISSGVVANKQELERSKISVRYYFQNVSIKTQLHNVNLCVKMFGIHRSIQSLHIKV